MGQQMKAGIIGIVFSVLLLLVGLVFSIIVVDVVNKLGGKIACFDGNGTLITNATYSSATAGVNKAKTLPKKVSKTFQGALAVGRPCGSGTLTDASTTNVENGAKPTGSWAGKQGTIRYTLEVFGADSLNNLMTLAFWIALIIIAIGISVGGGLAVRADLLRRQL